MSIFMKMLFCVKSYAFSYCTNHKGLRSFNSKWKFQFLTYSNFWIVLTSIFKVCVSSKSSNCFFKRNQIVALFKPDTYFCLNAHLNFIMKLSARMLLLCECFCCEFSFHIEEYAISNICWINALHRKRWIHLEYFSRNPEKTHEF